MAFYNIPTNKTTQDDLFHKLDQLKQEIAFIKKLLEEWLTAEDTEDDDMDPEEDTDDDIPLYHTPLSAKKGSKGEE